MDTALLFDDHGSGITRSGSENPILGSGPSGLPSPNSSPPREAAAANNPSSGGNGNVNNADPATGTRPSASPTAATAAPRSTDEDVSKLDLAIMACTITLVVAVAVYFKDLTGGWEAPWKELYGVLMIVSLSSTVTGFFTAWSPAVSCGRRLSPSCARIGLIDASGLFIVFLACKLGRLGWAAGVAAAALVVLVLIVAWAWSEMRQPATSGVEAAREWSEMRQPATSGVEAANAIQMGADRTSSW